MRRVLLAIDLLLVALAVGVGLTWDSRTAADEPAIVIHKVENASFVARQPQQPVFLLLIGNDARPGLEGVRGDAIHLVGINPAMHSATILNIPRDTWVPIAGHGDEKITRSMEFGGFQLEVQTVAALTGVPFSFAVTSGFEGFKTLVNEAGGVNVTVADRMYDTFSGADFSPGRTHMLGDGALSYARNRHIPNGDIQRTENQGWMLVAALERAREMSHNPFDTMHLLGLIARNTQVDGASYRDLFSLVSLGLSIDPANVRNVTMPSRIGKVGPADVVFVGPGAAELFADFRDDAILQSH